MQAKAIVRKIMFSKGWSNICDGNSCTNIQNREINLNVMNS